MVPEPSPSRRANCCLRSSERFFWKLWTITQNSSNSRSIGFDGSYFRSVRRLSLIRSGSGSGKPRTSRALGRRPCGIQPVTSSMPSGASSASAGASRSSMLCVLRVKPPYGSERDLWTALTRSSDSNSCTSASWVGSLTFEGFAAFSSSSSVSWNPSAACPSISSSKFPSGPSSLAPEATVEGPNSKSSFSRALFRATLRKRALSQPSGGSKLRGLDQAFLRRGRITKN
mmetsp:Transcript_137166/g.293013  ORF Transcript_137166/g.293013 Transcript_137166/m.293013 type:complete len:229 (-) Transcript_137166:542-1228(-)